MDDVEDIGIWAPVVGYEGSYSVSSLGEIRSDARVIVRSDGRKQTLRPRILRQSVVRNGNGRPSHMGVSLGILGGPAGAKYGAKPVHHLVLTAHVSPRPEGMEGCHNDGDITNNEVANLRWDTPNENRIDIIRHGNNVNANKTHCLNGHEFIQENIYHHKSGGRYCGECHRQRARARYASKRESK